MFGHNDEDQQGDGASQHQDNNVTDHNPIAQTPVAHDDSAASEPEADYGAGAGDTSYVSVSATPATDSNDQSASNPQHGAPSHGAASDDSDDLLGLKQQALQQLSPLINHLEQTPEEKFKTTMMMIQASDDKSLLKNAYTAAQEIPDEKAKAQALLDVINEINYFTQSN